MAQQFIYWIDYKVTQYRFPVNELTKGGGGARTVHPPIESLVTG